MVLGNLCLTNHLLFGLGVVLSSPLYLCFLLRIRLVYVHWVLWVKDQPIIFINIVPGMLEHDFTEVSSCYQSAK